MKEGMKLESYRDYDVFVGCYYSGWYALIPSTGGKKGYVVNYADTKKQALKGACKKAEKA